jgi:glycosyltransferase involved in cell wall biosynthesis
MSIAAGAAPEHTVHVVLPGDIDDPATPSGGNRYDRQVCTGLAELGWSVREHPVFGDWPDADPVARDELARLLAGLPDHAIVLIDGLIASTTPDALAPQASRLQLVVLMHMPVGGVSAELRRLEREALSAAAAVITPSGWSRQHLLDLHPLPAARVHAAAPGVDPAPIAEGTKSGSRLLCVAAVAPHKGYDLLLQALAGLANLTWSLVCVGTLNRDPAFVDELRDRGRVAGTAERISFVGPCTGPELEARYAVADLVVLPSRAETYGMVVTEALAHGTPVVATAVGGVGEALGRAPDSSLPGLLVGPDDPAALTRALRQWLTEPLLRTALRRSALLRRTTLTGWEITAKLISSTLSGLPTTTIARR